MFGFLFKPSSGILWALVNVPVFFSLFSVLVCVCFFYLLLPFLRLINFNFFVVLRYDAVASGAGTDADAFFRLSSLALSLSLAFISLAILWWSGVPYLIWILHTLIDGWKLIRFAWPVRSFNSKNLEADRKSFRSERNAYLWCWTEVLQFEKVTNKHTHIDCDKSEETNPNGG